jgi:transposase
MEITGRIRPFTHGIELALDETTGEGRMHGRVTKYSVRLNRKPRKRLETLVRRRTPQHWMVQRARVVLFSDDGLEIVEICRRLSVDHQVVRRWLRRYLADGFDGLKDRPRTGRPAVIEPHVWQKLATLVVQSPEKFGLPLARWSVRALEDFVAQRYGWRVSHASVSRFLRSMAIKPHRVQYWLNPTDPDFDNISTHTGDAAKAWLRRHPRVRFVFTPKHGSWLNQVEIWFGILTRSVLRHRSFDDVTALTKAIYKFTRHWNAVLAHPFEWTYTGKVLAA